MKIKHNLSNHRLYRTWHNMMARCYNKKAINYKNYGGRGITVYNEWHNVTNFINDMSPSYIEGLTLDRKENDKGYSKDNCRWEKQNIQHQNTRKIMITNTTGYRNIIWREKYQKWDVQFCINHTTKYIGRFSDIEKAILKRNNYIIDNCLAIPLI